MRLVRLIWIVLLGAAFLVPSSAQDTFRVWHYETSALADSWSRALDRFRAAHPGVKVELTVKTFDEARATADRILASDQGPDVMEFNKGNADAGYYGSRGALRNLTVDAQRLGWDRLLPPALQTTVKYDGRGRMGSGAWYGVSSYAEFVLVYYNKALFRQTGVKVPTTLEELEAALAQFHDAGIVPLAVGAVNHPAQHLFYVLYLSQATRQLVDDYQWYRAPVDFHSAPWLHAAQTLAAWQAAGYLSPKALSQDDEAMLAEFQAGKAAMMVSGSWTFPRLAASALDWGTFLFPGNRLHPGSGGNLWVVPARSRHPDWAVEFMNLTLDRDLQTSLANAGGLAINADPVQVFNPRSAELARAFAQVARRDGLAFYPDWPALGYYDSLVSAVRDLLRGVPPDQVLDGLDLAYRTKKGRS